MSLSTIPGGAAAATLWLVPDEPHRSRLRALIAELARETGGPVFEPHVTLLNCCDKHAAFAAASIE